MSCPATFYHYPLFFLNDQKAKSPILHSQSCVNKTKLLLGFVCFDIKYFQRNHFQISLENVFRLFRDEDCQQTRVAVANDLRQRWKMNCDKEKLKLQKWFTEIKKENHFKQLKGGFFNQLKMFSV
jgi:hypothetical protein